MAETYRWMLPLHFSYYAPAASTVHHLEATHYVPSYADIIRSAVPICVTDYTVILEQLLNLLQLHI